MKFIFLILIFFPKMSYSTALYDYYLEIPQEYLNIVSDKTGKSLKGLERSKIVKTRDDKNGFLTTQSDEVLSNFTLALFKRPQKSPLIAICEEGVSVQNIIFLTKIKDTWKDISREVFPLLSNDFIVKKYHEKINPLLFSDKEIVESAYSKIRFILPQVGSDIIAIAGIDKKDVYGKELFRLKFNGEKFEIK